MISTRTPPSCTSTRARCRVAIHRLHATSLMFPLFTPCAHSPADQPLVNWTTPRPNAEQRPEKADPSWSTRPAPAELTAQESPALTTAPGTQHPLPTLCGGGNLPAARSVATKKGASPPPGSPAKKTTDTEPTRESPVEKPGRNDGDGKNRQDVGLTVRIEVNLPPSGDADTYDLIFASIKKHLMS